MQIEAFIQLKHFFYRSAAAFQGRDSRFRCNLRRGHKTDREPGRLLQHFQEVCRQKCWHRWQAGQKDILFHLEQGFEFHFSSIQFIYKPFSVFGKESVCSCSI